MQLIFLFHTLTQTPLDWHMQRTASQMIRKLWKLEDSSGYLEQFLSQEECIHATVLQCRLEAAAEEDRKSKVEKLMTPKVGWFMAIECSMTNSLSTCSLAKP